jgi:hypothetical protein
MAVGGSERVAEAISTGIRIARDLFQDERANARIELGFWMRGKSIRFFDPKPLDLGFKDGKRLDEGTGAVELPAVALGKRPCGAVTK